MAYNINITDAELQKSAVTYRKELLMMPVVAAEATLKHMTPRPGVAGREVLGQLAGGIEIGPYDPNRTDDSGLSVKPRTLETFLGSVIKRFDLNSVAKTVYGSLTTQGDGLASLDLAQQVAGDQHGDLPLPIEPQDQLAHFDDALGIQAVDGFVQHEKVWISRKGNGDAQSLPHTERKILYLFLYERKIHHSSQILHQKYT